MLETMHLLQHAALLGVEPSFDAALTRARAAQNL
jgi:hypothetical protein